MSAPPWPSLNWAGRTGFSLQGVNVCQRRVERTDCTECVWGKQITKQPWSGHLISVHAKHLLQWTARPPGFIYTICDDGTVQSCTLHNRVYRTSPTADIRSSFCISCYASIAIKIRACGNVQRLQQHSAFHCNNYWPGVRFTFINVHFCDNKDSKLSNLRAMGCLCGYMVSEKSILHSSYLQALMQITVNPQICP